MKLYDLPMMMLPTEPDSHPEWDKDFPEHPDVTKWNKWDDASAEVETIEFLYSLVRLIKPKLIVETGPFIG